MRAVRGRTGAPPTSRRQDTLSLGRKQQGNGCGAAQGRALWGRHGCGRGRGREPFSNRKLCRTAGPPRAGTGARSGARTSLRGPWQRGGVKEDSKMGSSVSEGKSTGEGPARPLMSHHSGLSPYSQHGPYRAGGEKTPSDTQDTGPMVWERPSQGGASRSASRRRGHLAAAGQAGTAALPRPHHWARSSVPGVDPDWS